jgi:hypothetical protein
VKFAAEQYNNWYQDSTMQPKGFDASSWSIPRPRALRTASGIKPSYCQCASASFRGVMCSRSNELFVVIWLGGMLGEGANDCFRRFRTTFLTSQYYCSCSPLKSNIDMTVWSQSNFVFPRRHAARQCSGRVRPRASLDFLYCAAFCAPVRFTAILMEQPLH